MFRPMKGAVAPTDLSSLRYPLLASEKIDGWRCLIADAEWARDNIPCEPKHHEYFAAARHAIALSASLKPISNWWVQRQLDSPELVGCDGELIASDRFNETSSAFASHGGEPSFAFHIFDLFDRSNDPFESRLLALKNKALPWAIDSVEFRKHPHFQIMSAAHLTEYLEEQLPAGAEGAVTRDPRGLYKFGRATEKQQWLLKVKPFVDAEAIVIGTEELLHNLNDPEVSQLGLQRRSHHQAGKVPSGKLGALICRKLVKPAESGTEHGGEFKIGTGFDDAQRHLLWAQRDELFGRIVKYKSMQRGVLEAPRHPVFLGFRAEDYSA
jgi:DNA ligase 1